MIGPVVLRSKRQTLVRLPYYGPTELYTTYRSTEVFLCHFFAESLFIGLPMPSPWLIFQKRFQKPEARQEVRLDELTFPHCNYWHSPLYFIERNLSKTPFSFTRYNIYLGSEF